jgi:uncharacterized membrane protein
VFAGVVLPLNEKEYLIPGLNSIIDDLLDFVIAVFHGLRLAVSLVLGRGLLVLLLCCVLNVLVLLTNLHCESGFLYVTRMTTVIKLLFNA